MPGVERVLRHRSLVGVDDVESFLPGQPLQRGVHLADLIPHDDRRPAGESRDQQRAGVPQPGAAHWYCMHSVTDAFQVGYVLGAVVCPHEGDQRDLVPLRQVE